MAVGVDRVHGDPAREQPGGDQPVRLLLRPRPVVAARRDDDDLRIGRRHVLPRHGVRARAGRTEGRFAAGELDHLGDPVPRRVRRVGPLEDDDPWPKST